MTNTIKKDSQCCACSKPGSRFQLFILFGEFSFIFWSLKFAREEVNQIKIRSAYLSPFFLIYAATRIFNSNQIGGVVRIYICQFIMFNVPHTTRIVYLIYDFASGLSFTSWIPYLMKE
jgi:hypothetical protein